jgi:hypothetical protein
MRLRATWARHLCRTNRSIFEYLNIKSCFREKSNGRRECQRKQLFSHGPSFEFDPKLFTLMGRDGSFDTCKHTVQRKHVPVYYCSILSNFFLMLIGIHYAHDFLRSYDMPIDSLFV